VCLHGFAALIGHAHHEATDGWIVGGRLDGDRAAALHGDLNIELRRIDEEMLETNWLVAARRELVPLRTDDAAVFVCRADRGDGRGGAHFDEGQIRAGGDRPRCRLRDGSFGRERAKHAPLAERLCTVCRALDAREDLDLSSPA
jgi:hypothetical protein